MASISDIFVEAITDASVKVYWTTDIPGTSYVEYGRDTSYGNISTIDELPRVCHLITLTGLVNNTTYHYKVVTEDVYGVLHTSSDHTFTTLESFSPSGTNYYVSTSGSNSNNGLTLGTAWRTVAHAASQVSAGDTVEIVDGVYEEPNGVTIGTSGTDVNPITFKAYNGTPHVDRPNDGGYAVTIHGSYVDTQGLKFTGNGYICVDVEETEHVNILNCEVGPAGFIGIYSEGNRYLTIDSCDVHNTGWNAVMIGVAQTYGLHSHHNSITNCKIHDSYIHGLIDITVHWGSTYSHHHFDIINNKLYNSVGALFFHWDVRPEMRVFNVANNYVHHIDYNAFRTDALVNSFFYNNTCEEISGYDFLSTEGCTNVTFIKNTVQEKGFENTYIKGPGLLFDQNKIPYVRISEGDAIVRNHEETEFKVTMGTGTMTVEYTDGRTFSVDDIGEYTTYTLTSGTHIIRIVGTCPEPQSLFTHTAQLCI